MFTKKGPNLIESDEGFSVEVLGRTGLRYVQENKRLRVDSEILAGPALLAVLVDSIKQWESGESIDAETKHKIIDNIRRAFKSQGEEIQVIGDWPFGDQGKRKVE